jgi:hypothetical protein
MAYIIVVVVLLVITDLKASRLAAQLHEAYLLLGYKPDAKDGDGDGIVQDGTKWARKAK